MKIRPEQANQFRGILHNLNQQAKGGDEDAALLMHVLEDPPPSKAKYLTALFRLTFVWPVYHTLDRMLHRNRATGKA